tara:strand:- start:5198 stop:5926 length:729 start_codon:yes stop_codon:yes gene_type:complete
MSEFKFPTEEVDLPSKGLIYPKDNPLSSGKIEVKYMTAKEEDILSNQSYIQKGTVLDKLLDSVIVSKDVDHRDLIVGDKNALLIATRILGYGKDYTFERNGEKYTVDLNSFENNDFDEDKMINGKNEFSFTLPFSSIPITYKLLTGRDEKKIEAEVKGIQRISKDSNPELSTRLKFMILSVDGETENKTIREFVDNRFLARDSRAFRDEIRYTQPDIDLRHTLDTGEEVTVPIGLTFFWPDL